MQHSWSPRQRRFILWRAVPKMAREPRTQELFADEMGVNPSTLYRWSKLPGFKEEVTNTARELLKDEVPDLYGSLLLKALTGDVPALRLAFEMIGELDQESSGSFRVVIDWGGASDDD